MGSTNTGATVTNELVRAAVLGKVGTDHLRLDLDLHEGLSVMHANDRADHFRYDDHVTQMRLHGLRLLMLRRLLLRLIQLLNKRHRLASQTAVELSPRTGREQRQKLDGLQRQQRIEVNAAECKLAERPALAGGRDA